MLSKLSTKRLTSQYLSAKKIIKTFKKIGHLKAVYLISCRGAKGAKKSLAYAFYNRTKYKAKVYAAYQKISFRSFYSRAQNKVLYTPRYSWAYMKKYGYQYYFKNPVKKRYG